MGARATVIIVVLALASAGAGLLLGRWLAAPGSDPASAPALRAAAVSVGQPLPAVALSDLDGHDQALGQWRGRPLLLNFWATWCAPCIEEMPVLDAFASDQGADGVQVVGIALDDPDAVRAFLARVPVRYPILLGGLPGGDDLSVRLGNRHAVLPYTVLVDGGGRLRAGHFGDFDARELAEWVEAHRGDE